MNYETKLKNFIEEYATALFGTNDTVISIETDYDEGKILLTAYNNSNNAGVTSILEYDFRSNHGVNEENGEDKPKFFFQENPQVFIRDLVNSNVSKSLLKLFGRYCNIFSINYIIQDIPYFVASEDNPQKEMAISHSGISTEYRKITMSAQTMQIAVEVYFKDGGLFTQMLLESIEE